MVMVMVMEVAVYFSYFFKVSKVDIHMKIKIYLTFRAVLTHFHNFLKYIKSVKLS